MPILRLPTAATGLKATHATVLRWLKESSQPFKQGDLLVELEVDDAILRIDAPQAGTLGRIIAPAKATIALGAELAEFSTSTAASPTPAVSPTPIKGTPPMQNTPAAGKVTPILMPQAGNTMEEGRILSWKVKPGDRINVGQVICEIETDKATIEFESTDAGRLARIVAADGAVVAVKQPIAFLADNDADVDAAQGGAPAPTAAATSAPAAPVAGKAPTGNVAPILMPQVGNSMEEGTILNWKVNPGDTIKVGQIIFEIDTDKASVEVESTQAGRLSRIIAPPGSVIPIKQPVAFIADNDSDVDAFLASGGSSAPAVTTPISTASATQTVAAPTSAPATRTSDGRVKASPAARRIASEKGLNLAGIGAGSGPGGRILSTDLGRAPAAASAPRPAAAPVAVSGQVTRKPMSKMRKAIATNLQTSKQTIPHFYVTLTINADPLFAFYRAQKPTTGCTLNDVVLLAVGKTVHEFPGFRSRIEGNDIVELPNANIGVAVSVDDGLVVPVMMALEGHSLSSLPAESKRVVESARKGRLENIGKGVFTISNMGMLGVEDFSAIINPPESGILAVSAVREAVLVKDGAMRAGRVMTMTLSVDHRVVDGAMAATFMGKLKERLEKPETLL